MWRFAQFMSFLRFVVIAGIRVVSVDYHVPKPRPEAIAVTVRRLDRLPPEAGKPVGAPVWVGMAPARSPIRGLFQQRRPPGLSGNSKISSTSKVWWVFSGKRRS